MESSSTKKVRRLGVVIALAITVAVSGCGKDDPQEKESTPKTVQKKSAPAQIPVKKVKTEVVPLDPRLHQSFEQATIAEPAGGQFRPPDQTKSGKNVAKLYLEVAGRGGKGGLWDSIRFQTPSGKRIAYRAIVKTDLGDIQIAFFPNEAPNHVRNFLALAKAGYYDGLAFDRKVSGGGNFPAALLEAGCPVGTGDPGFGSIGYWMMPELNPKRNHEPGTIGAWHAEELESAASKFYITLNNAQWMNGHWTVFAKVTQGLDVVQRIFKRPTSVDDPERPVDPVVIRKIEVTSQELDPTN